MRIKEYYIRKCEHRKNIVRMLFARESLVYDIRNTAYIVGKTHEAPIELTDICEGGNIDRVDRVIDMAYHEVEEMLFPYTKGEIQVNEHRIAEIDDYCDDTGILGDIDPSERVYDLQLKCSADISETSLKLVRAYIQEYITMRVLHDWTTLVWADGAAIFVDKLASAGDGINKAMQTKRIGKVTVRKQPF